MTQPKLEPGSFTDAAHSAPMAARIEARLLKNGFAILDSVPEEVSSKAPAATRFYSGQIKYFRSLRRAVFAISDDGTIVLAMSTPHLVIGSLKTLAEKAVRSVTRCVLRKIRTSANDLAVMNNLGFKMAKWIRGELPGCPPPPIPKSRPVKRRQPTS